jgi:hypothetical protein
MAKQTRVEVVKSGLCTGTLRPDKLQECINQMSGQGWVYKNCQDVMGRRCGCLPYQELFVIFEKD